MRCSLSTNRKGLHPQTLVFCSIRRCTFPLPSVRSRRITQDQEPTSDSRASTQPAATPSSCICIACIRPRRVPIVQQEDNGEILRDPRESGSVAGKGRDISAPRRRHGPGPGGECRRSGPIDRPDKCGVLANESRSLGSWNLAGGSSDLLPVWTSPRRAYKRHGDRRIRGGFVAMATLPRPVRECGHAGRANTQLGVACTMHVHPHPYPHMLFNLLTSYW